MDIKKSLSSIYATLNQLELKATSQNVKLLTGVYVEIENIIREIEKTEE